MHLSFIFASVLLLLVPLGVVDSEAVSELELRQAADTAGLTGATAQWAEETPIPGDLVKFRLRDACLSHVLTNPAQFEVQVDGEAVPAVLLMPEPRRHPEKFEISITAESAADEADLVIDLDRGENAAPINRLQLGLASGSLTAKAFVAAGRSPDQLDPASPAQLVFQRVDQGQVRSLTTLECDPGGSRYLRIRIVGGGGREVTRVEAWLEPEDNQETYAVAAALGPMEDGLLLGEHLWPVILKDYRAPLCKIKVLADAPGESRLVSVQRTDEHTGASSMSRATWVDQIRLGSLELSNKWVELSGETMDADMIVSVEDGQDEPLQLKGVQAYAYEVWVAFERPQSDDVTLWLDSTGPQLTLPEDQLAAARYGGEFSDLSLARPVAEEMAGRGLGGLFSSVGGLRMLIYAAAALVALLIGVMLLRRPRTA